ncbi:hypothetical protein IGB42_02956 [Andreprevotia sp. IGB-42]|uniref:GFA family protein n=1 Tax=Andreprevotia sp. IGB-42 TaxID=2497473 RepID=UPI00135B07FD|nr:GFA family protein [Andreprevotia sp. IGB-42]KAF0812664.1 hypothetical protein IGB42_02956 [Andreprevotia sp. IGB-42]
MSHILNASCECGAVQFTSTHAPILQLYCHCSDCQHATGNAYARTAFFRLADADISGTLAIHRYQAASGAATTREACASCGTLLFDRSAGFPGLIGVMVETLGDGFAFSPSCHMWTRSKRVDVTIPDGIAQFPESPPFS